MAQYDQSDARGFQLASTGTMGDLAAKALSAVHERRTVTNTGMRRFVLNHLLRALVDIRRFDAVAMMEELRGHRLSVDEIIDLYIPEASRALGEMWIRDEVSFATVTIGALRLQNLLGEASDEDRAEPVVGRMQVHALIVVPAGEQHFLGASVLGAQLRRLGCDIMTSFDETMGELSARLKRQPPEIVLISCASKEGLERVRETVLCVRTSLASEPVIALGGAVCGSEPEIKEETGVDIVTCEAKEAVAFCVKRMSAPNRR